MDNAWCENKITPYFGLKGPYKSIRHSISDAKNDCTSNMGCTMFYDLESKNETYALCGPNKEIKHSLVQSRLYIKCKRLILYALPQKN